MHLILTAGVTQILIALCCLPLHFFIFCRLTLLLRRKYTSFSRQGAAGNRGLPCGQVDRGVDGFEPATLRLTTAGRMRHNTSGYVTVGLMCRTLGTYSTNILTGIRRWAADGHCLVLTDFNYPHVDWADQHLPGTGPFSTELLSAVQTVMLPSCIPKKMYSAQSKLTSI